MLTTQIRDGIRNVFTEDTGMLQAQQQAIEANPDYEFYNLNIDAGGMWIRRFIERAAGGRRSPRRSSADNGKDQTHGCDQQ